jgi:hypothetical protein
MLSIGYENSTLEIEFPDHAVWQYQRVPSHVYQALVASPSRGAYFCARIKGRFQERKVKGGDRSSASRAENPSRASRRRKDGRDGSW